MTDPTIGRKVAEALGTAAHPGLSTATAPAILPTRIPEPQITRPQRAETRVVEALESDRY